MAFFNYSNVTISGIAAAVPIRVIDNLNSLSRISKQYDNKEFVEQTGVEKRHYDENLTTSDLGFAAATRLLEEMKINREDIEALIFVSQSFDFIAPATACILQDKLGLTRECLAFDVELGCSGWIYGLNTLASLLQNGCIKKALLIVGDGKRNYENAEKYSGALFGHAATATVLEFKKESNPMYFHLGTDGSGYKALMVKGGGARFPFNSHSLDEYELNGEITTDLSSHMNGMDVFSFGISTAPKSIKKLMKEVNQEPSNVDYLILHQANKQMNEIIAKKLKFDSSKVPGNLANYGNTSSASIPLTIVTELGNVLSHGSHSLICCGFGIGLSWGSLYCKVDNLIIPKLVEVASHERIL